MKITIWDLLTALILVATLAVIVVFGLLFFQPTVELNPFPPPTNAVSLILPTSTNTLLSLPPTWTQGIEPVQQSAATLTRIPTATWVYFTRAPGLPTYTLSPTPTLTFTVTQTPTRTRTLTPVPSLTRTITRTPNLTNTALALTNTAIMSTQQTRQAATLSAQQTSQAATASALQTGQAATATQAALPANPTSAVDLNGSDNDTWQSSVPDPSFVWNAITGANGYYVYWGTNPYGTSSTLVTSAAYDAPSATSGVYYLRGRTRFSWGYERQDWATIYIFRLDNSAPSNPTSASDINSIPNGTWQNANGDPNFTWSGASDGTGTGIDYYNIYWGTNSSGTSTTATVYDPTTAYDPAPVSSGTYYLRIQTVDLMGNAAGWNTLFTLKFDNEEPTDPSGVTELVGDPNHPTPSFSWTGSSDTHSGILRYEIYWGTNPDSETVMFTSTGTSFHVENALTINGVYYLKVRAVDNAGNFSGWASGTFTYTGGS